MKLVASREYILQELQSKLAPALSYHGVHHVNDVVNAAMSLAEGECIRDAESLILLETAALYHDSGFMYTYKDHEDAGCEIVQQVLPRFEYNSSQIDIICGMIMATKIPQSPQTHLERIICDADLDYLGRADFEPIASTLFEELKVLNVINDLDTWNRIQVDFLQKHHFWTETAKRAREEVKQLHLGKLIQLVSQSGL